MDEKLTKSPPNFMKDTRSELDILIHQMSFQEGTKIFPACWTTWSMPTNQAISEVLDIGLGFLYMDEKLTKSLTTFVLKTKPSSIFKNFKFYLEKGTMFFLELTFTH